MKIGVASRLAIGLIATGLLPLSQALAAETTTGVASTCLTRTRASIAAIVRGDFPTASKDFSPPVASKVTPAKLRQAWQALTDSAGKYRTYGKTVKLKLGSQSFLLTPVTFAHAHWALLSTCDGMGAITMFRLVTTGQVNAAVAVEKRAVRDKVPIKPHLLADGAHVKPLPVPSPYGPLRGALTLPKGRGPFPAVVLVGGSGPNDLNETDGGSKPFRDIAHGLAAAGIASLRYDKRQTDYPFRMAANKHLTVDEEETDDALAAAHLLAEQKQIDPHRLFVLGHSEGGMLAPRIGKRDSQLAGIIMMAAPARKMLAVMREQSREQGERNGNSGAQIAAAQKILAAEQELLDKANPKHPPQGDFAGAPQSWWLSLHQYNQVATAKALSMPILILQGGSDFQVSPKHDFDAWKAALTGKPRVTFRLYPGLSHLFTPAGKTLTPADYAKPEHVAPAVIHDIAAWIKLQPPAR